MIKELFKFIIKVANPIIQLIVKLKIAIFLKPKKSKALVLMKRRIISTFLTQYKSQRLKLKRFYFPSSILPNSHPYSPLWLIVNTIAWKYSTNVCVCGSMSSVYAMVLLTGVVKELGNGLVPGFSQFLTNFDRFLLVFTGPILGLTLDSVFKIVVYSSWPSTFSSICYVWLKTIICIICSILDRYSIFLQYELKPLHDLSLLCTASLYLKLEEWVMDLISSFFEPRLIGLIS